MYFPQGGNQCQNPADCGGNVYRQTFFMPEPPPEHIMCRKRLPTPPPNIHEQTIIVRPPRQIIHEVVEQPMCPPPVIRKNFVMGNPEPPQYLSSTVCVQPQTMQGGMMGQYGGVMGGQAFLPSYGSSGIATMPGGAMGGYPALGGSYGVPGGYPPMAFQ